MGEGILLGSKSLVVDGRRTDFLKDYWYGSVPFVKLLPKSDGDIPSCSVQEVLGDSCHPLWRVISDSASACIKDFPLSDGSDRVVWGPSQSSDFSIKSAYELVRDKSIVREPLMKLWLLAFPPKAAMLCWKISNRILPVDLVVMECGIYMVSKCSYCSSSMGCEDLDHLFVKGFLLLARVIAVTFCVTLAASVAARHGPIPMAAFQICLQVWLSTSLLADGLAVAGQAILASSFATGDHQKVVAAASRVLQLSVVLGLALSALIGIGMQFGSGIFTKDKNVLKLIHTVLPFVAATQPINSLAFVFDGINFGASDYAYSAYSMVLVAIISIVSLFLLSSSHGFVGIWIALTIYISLRTFAGVWRMGAARGPWTFLRNLSISG